MTKYTDKFLKDKAKKIEKKLLNKTDHLEPKIITNANYQKILIKYKVHDLDKDWKEIIFSHATLGAPVAIKYLSKLTITKKHLIAVIALKIAQGALKLYYKIVKIR